MGPEKVNRLCGLVGGVRSLCAHRCDYCCARWNCALDHLDACLHYNVYSDDIYWYREDFPTYFNLIVTAVLSLVLGLIAAGVIWIVR